MHEQARINQVLQLCAQSLTHFSGLKLLDPDSPAVDALPETLRLPRLQELDLSHAKLRDETLVSFLRASAGSLEAIYLVENQRLQFGRKLTDTFPLLTSLRALNLKSCAIDDETAHRLPLHLLTGLQTLNLAANQLTGRLAIGCPGQHLWQIRTLYLNDNRSLSRLRQPLTNFIGSKNLDDLNLADTSVSLDDEDELHALRYEQMRVLTLDRLVSVDDGVAARFPSFFRGSLELLHVRATSITGPGLENLRRSLPSTKVKDSSFDW